SRNMAGSVSSIAATGVVRPADAHPFAGLRRIRAGLALHGHRPDAVVVHGALPDGAVDSPDPWLAALAGRRREELAELAAASDGVPVLTTGFAEATLEAVADRLYGAGPGPEPRPAEPWTVEDRLAAEGLLVWHLALPGSERADLDLVRRGDELVVGLGAHRRVLTLPSALRRCTVAGAGLHDGALTVRFAPDPALWPRS
ncbi:ArsA family ATPase, partial [Kitasatospora sp. NPDC001574]